MWNTVIAPRTIRAKLFRILVLALALVLALLGSAVATQISTYREAADTVYQTKLLVTLQSFVHEEQKERGLTDALIAGTTAQWPNEMAERKLSAQTASAVHALVKGRHDAASNQARAGLDSMLAGLVGIRQAVDNGHGDLLKNYWFFTDNNTKLTHFTFGLENASDPELRNHIQALLTLGNGKEAMGEQRALMTGSLPQQHFVYDWYTQYVTDLGTREANIKALPLWTTPREQSAVDAVWTTDHAKRVLGWEQMAIRQGGRLDPTVIPPTQWYTGMTQTINDLRTVQVAYGDDVIARAEQLQADAEQQVVLFSLLALAAVAILGGLSVGAARSISGPLGVLARKADRTATETLPEAVNRVQETGGAQEAPEPLRIPEHSGHEVRLVAEAFDKVQRVAFDLATEQTVLRKNATESLVNLGRRNQNLVRRQIGFINKLEHEDADPQQLANLFELDHLATRMRRNAESLLVLAGEASPRPWAQPLTVTDVIRAALSEVEEYRRVTLRRIDQIKVNGSVVAEVAHLLAELVENALSFSPPDSDVEIEGRRTSNGYLIAIVDHGLGMSPEAIAEANVRLSGSASFMAEPTKFLGHYVVGSLAKRHSIDVRLGEAPAAGVVARVLLPAALLAESMPGHGAPANMLTSSGSAATRSGDRSEERAVEEVHVQRTDRGTELPVDDAPELQREIDTGALPEIRSGEMVGQRIGELEAAAPVEELRGPVSGGGAYGAGAARIPGARSASGARTRNGLVKRPRRSAISAAVNETSGRWQAGEERTPERSPEEVKAMLSALRSAHDRGARTTSSTGSSTGSNSNSSSTTGEGGVS
ncbi:sensor histidine kinase [Phaeacidiphilus oryzae]|uniref:sensor histidine kinase n=1 Tax=Phaeacidiphilus oryzae TaxID=348818 RepID=UPI001377362E|nr:ATP-binding protein [Phaeacidiphilus oryzae]